MQLIEVGYEVVIVDDLSNSNIDVIDRIDSIAKAKSKSCDLDIKNL